ncbi:MAG: DUF819 family protein [Bacteroidota bacterium]
MESIHLVLQIACILLGPYLCIRLSGIGRLGEWLSPVVLSYGLGIALANSAWLDIQTSISTTFSEATILLAIPLLLLSTDLLAWLRQARSTLISFGLCVFSGTLLALSAALVFDGYVEQTWIVSGMLVGVYTGGTPNMQAIGLALGAPNDLYILLNAADIFCGGIYLLLLTSVVHRVFGLFLSSYRPIAKEKEEASAELPSSFSWKGLFKGLGLTIGIIGLTVGLTWLTTGGLEHSGLILLLLTSFAILASMDSRIRAWSGTYEGGEYLLLMFCVAVGMLSDFTTLWQDGGQVIAYTSYVLVGTIVLHLLLCGLFGIDRDTAMITSTAALYGPAFIGQVASAIGNRELVFAGMATGLVGMALGNYLGIGIGELLRVLLVQ